MRSPRIPASDPIRRASVLTAAAAAVAIAAMAADAPPPAAPPAPAPAPAATTARPAASTPAGTAAPTPAPEAAAGAPSAATETIAGFREPQTYLDFAVAGGILMIPIAFSSVLWLAFLVERLAATRRSKVVPRPLVRAMKDLERAGTLEPSRVVAVIDAHPSAAAIVLRTALRRLDGPRQDLELAVNSVAGREIRSLRRNIRVFNIIAGVAPLLGLLGTVQGMIQAFRTVASIGLGAGQNLAPGIYIALITTAAGLMVAIPSSITYWWLTARVDRQVHEIDDLVVALVEARAPEGAKP